jgi:hypothetical protein
MFRRRRAALIIGGSMVRSFAFTIAIVLGAADIAAAQSSEDQAACQDDAFRLCSQTIPDRERTFQCMIANKDVLSPGCRAVIARSLPDPAPQKTARSKKGQGPVNLKPTTVR